MVSWRWYALVPLAVVTVILAGSFGWWIVGVAVAAAAAIRKH